jgi:uncharacterized membrane protein YecN with MAPEG domain
MHRLVITAVTSGLLGLLLVVLSARVVMYRREGLQDDKAGPLFVAIRSHANFTEYVPLSLLLIGIVEAHYGSTWYVAALAIGLILARLAHPIGMTLPAPNAPRIFGFVVTMLVLLAGSLLAISAAF